MGVMSWDESQVPRCKGRSEENRLLLLRPGAARQGWGVGGAAWGVPQSCLFDPEWTWPKGMRDSCELYYSSSSIARFNLTPSFFLCCPDVTQNPSHSPQFSFPVLELGLNRWH